jgi:hypothetical protein
LYITQFYNQINFFITLINGGDIDGGDLTCITKKCYVLSIKKQKPAFLQQVQNNPYHGLQISGFKVDNTYRKCSKKKDQFDLGLSQKKPQILSTTYISLVRSTMEYGGIIWDPYTETNINRLERIQRQAARFITGDYRSREEESVSNILVKLEL